MKIVWTTILLCAATLQATAADKKAIDFHGLRHLVADWNTAVSSFSGQFTEHVQQYDVSAVAPEEMIKDPIVVDFLWSSHGWYEKCASNGVSNVVYDGRTTTYFSQNNVGDASALISQGEGLPHNDFPLFLLQKRMPLVAVSVQSLLEDARATFLEIDTDNVEVSLILDDVENTKSVNMRFSRDKGWLLGEYTALRTHVSKKTAETLTDRFHGRFDTWTEVSDELTGNRILLPVVAVGTWTTDGVTVSTSKKEVRDLRVNPPVPKTALHIEFPIGTQVRSEAAPGRPSRKYIVGGEAALAQETARQDHLIKETIAAVAATGIKIRATPDRSRFVPAMSLIGAALLIGAVVLQWRRFLTQRRSKS